MSALTACGGSDDLTGTPKVPEGYTLYKGAGVSFAHPRGWKITERTTADGTPEIQVTDPAAKDTPSPLILLLISAGAEKRFESLVDQRRVVMTEVHDGEIESDSAVELDGAKKALRTTTKTPPAKGTKPVEVRSASIDAVRENGDVVVLVAAAPQRGDSTLDPEKVIDSLRLNEGS